jgi:hypothetical protein
MEVVAAAFAAFTCTEMAVEVEPATPHYPVRRR